MYKVKKWFWTTITRLMGVDRAYAKYLAHFNKYQQDVDPALQKELNVNAMSKEDFLKVWTLTKKSKKGCC